MKELEKLSFENIRVSYKDIIENIKITVVDYDNPCLAEADCTVFSLNEFVVDWFYSKVLYPELNYFFLEMLTKEERKITDAMSINEYIKYLNSKFNENDTIIINELYQTYLNLEKYISTNILTRHRECILINSIESYHDNTGAGTLIVDYLKDKYELIFLYSIEDAEEYWLDKVNFKEIFNSFMYWTNNKKLNEIL